MKLCRANYAARMHLSGGLSFDSGPYFSQARKSNRFPEASRSSRRVKRANHANDLSDYFSVRVISEMFGPEERSRVRVDNDQTALERAARQCMRSVAPREKIQSLVPERFSEIWRWRSPLAIDHGEECARECWVQRYSLSAHPEDVVKGKIGEPQDRGKRVPKEEGRCSVLRENRAEES